MTTVPAAGTAAAAAGAGPVGAGLDFAVPVSALRSYFTQGATLTHAWRQAQLKAIKRMVEENEEEIQASIRADLRKCEFESFVGEVAFILGEIKVALSNLKSWMRPEKRSTHMLGKPGSSTLIKEPQGTVLILGAWNFPWQLVVVPLLSAVAAGNCVVVKPSELAPASSALMARLLPRYVDNRAVLVVEGGQAESTALLALRFDHIFYTGGGAVGSIVLTAAARHLTPVTLELGGKSPCIVAADCDLAMAARRILSGKAHNAGQVCVAPDYVLVEASAEASLLGELVKAHRQFFGENSIDSPDLARIVNARHFNRLRGLLETCGGEVVVGGQTDEATRFIAPTVIRNPRPDADIMRDEIFGPLLPVISVPSIAAAIEFVRARPHPLALYVFSSSKATVKRVVDSTSSGGVTINDTMIHPTNPSLPFGGVGPSGMGSYHGEFGFKCFTHLKPVMHCSTLMDPKFRYPPYTPKARKIFSLLLLGGWLRALCCCCCGGKPQRQAVGVHDAGASAGAGAGVGSGPVPTESSALVVRSA